MKSTHTASKHASRIFISYRRQDSEQAASRLAADLRRYFGRKQVFQDFASIDPGAEVVQTVQRGLDTCAAVLVVIGPQWLSPVDRDGRPIDAPGKWVRYEVAESLKRSGVRVIPVLLDDAKMPSADDVPDDLKRLADRHAFPLTNRHWPEDVEKLVRSLREVPGLNRSLARWAWLGMAVAVSATLGYWGLVVRGEPDPLADKADEVGPVGKPARKRGEVFRDCSDCPEMVVIPEGGFLMGSPKEEPGRQDTEGPQHPVKIARSYALGKHEVTVGEFKRFVQATRYQTEAERDPDRGIGVFDEEKNKWAWSRGKSWRNPGFTQDDRHPVVGVSWNDALAYVDWLAKQTGQAYRLPSEAEWEHAARAGTTTARFWGSDANQACAYANVGDRSLKSSRPKWPYVIHECEDGFLETAPVGRFAANHFGLRDVIGNAWEWTQDCWNESYSGAPADGSPWLKGDCGRRVVRGGSWDFTPEYARAAFRNGNVPGVRYSVQGFRLARTL